MIVVRLLGKVIVVKDVQLENAFIGMVVIEVPDILILVTPEPVNTYWFIVVRPLGKVIIFRPIGKVIVDKDVHSLNAFGGMVVTEVLDILILVRPDFANAYSPMAPVSEFGKVMLDKDVQPLNAYLLIVSRPLGKVMLDRPELANALSPMVVTEVLDILILVTPELANACVPMVPVSEFGKSMLDKDVQPLNA